MNISYAPLWRTMKSKHVSQYQLIHHYGISSGQLHRLRHDMYVSTHTLEVLCNLLRCTISDVVEVH